MRKSVTYLEDDAKNGFYVENLTEEYVSCYEDVTQILIKGLSNRKTGTTRINSKSSRSHVMFTYIIESWCKASILFITPLISRIILLLKFHPLEFVTGFENFSLILAIAMDISLIHLLWIKI